MISLKALKKICLVIAIEHALIVTSASAATISVNNPGDTSGDDMACTLREAIQSIHVLDTTSTGCVLKSGFFGIEDTIVFEPALANLPIRLDQVIPLLIEKDLFINGLGADKLTIDGSSNGSAGIFDIRGSGDEAKVNVRIDNLTISGGSTNAGGGSGVFVHYAELSLGNSTITGNTTVLGGGGIDSRNSTVHLTDSTIFGNQGIRGGGGIRSNSSVIHLSDSTISGNTAGNGSGGGIYSRDSSISLVNSIVSDNSAISGGGGISSVNSSIDLVNSIVSDNSARSGGGGFSNFEGTIKLYDSTLSNNVADDGGGIFTYGGIVDLVDSTISSNSADNYGGAIALKNEATLNLYSSTLSSNTAQKFGGGIHALGGEVTVKTSTISGNTAGQGGGGVFFGTNDPDTPLKIAQSTIVNNFTNDDGGGIALVGDGTVVLTNSIIAGNVAADLGDEFAQFGGTFDAVGFNVLGDSSNTNAEAFSGGYSPDLAGLNIIATSNGTLPTALTSILNTTLTNNGGPTKTHALVIDSPAIDAGFLCSSFDQRGIRRDFGECDIGSYEFKSLIFSDSFE